MEVLLYIPMVVTEPSITSARPLGLGSKLYPSSMQRMLNKDVTRFKHILSGQRQNRANATKALLAGETIRECEQSNKSHLLTFELQHTTKTTFFLRIALQYMTGAKSCSSKKGLFTLMNH